LKEFDNLDPSALDTIFEYKVDEAKEEMDDLWVERMEMKN
jgi:hypothetical protein